MWILVIFIIVGFTLSKILAGKKEGEEGIVKSLRFSYKGYFIHIHHWLYSLIILIILIYASYFN